MPTMPTTPTTPTTPPASLATPQKKPKQRNRSGPRTKNGSYRHYYERRHDALHPDDRLPLLRHVCNSHPTSFTILDIGCNDGTLTTELASLPSCTRAIGVDINPNLIGDARKKLRALVEKRDIGVAALQGPLPGVCDSLPINVRQAVQLGKEPRMRNGVMDNCLLTQLNGDKSFPGNLTFRTEDFAQPEATRTSQEVGQYDIVLCLSITKWVHFAWGDKGLERMFRRIYECLKPGGILVLEPQPMKSYKSAIRKGLGKKDLKGERKLRPHEFPDFLKSPIGFGEMKVLRKTRERGHAFNRPIMAFLKGSLSSHALTLPHPHPIFGERPYHIGLEHVNNVHHHIVPGAPVLDIIAPENVPLADPALPNVAPANAAPLEDPAPPNVVPANATPANAAPVNSTPENAAPASPATSAAAPTAETHIANGEEDGQIKETETDAGNDGRQVEGPVAAPQENTIQESLQPVNPEVSASPLNETGQRQGDETGIEANTGAANYGNIVPRTSGRKRTRSDEGTEEGDERCAKVAKHDTAASTQRRTSNTLCILID